MISHKLATMTNALLNVSVMCQKHKASVLRYEKWAVFLSRRVCSSVCVSSSCQNILSNPPTGWSSTAPRCLTTIKAFSHLVFSEHLVIKFTAKCHKKTKKNTNTKYTLDVQINTLPFWLSWLFTWPCLSLWHHQLEGRKEHGNQTSGDDVSRPVLPDGVWIERVRAGAPLLWLRVLIRQAESDTTAGWSEIARFVAQACRSCWIGQLWCFSWRLRQTKACAHLSRSRERK